MKFSNQPREQRTCRRLSCTTDLEFGLESLERRQMLAGSVTASVAGGSLVVSGDGQDNAVVISQYNDQLAVVGLNTEIAEADISDTILGVDVSIKFLDGVTKDVNVLLRGGDDTLLLGGSVQESVTPEGDALVADDVTVETLVLPRNVNIWTHGGRDAVVVAGTEVAKDLSIDTGFGQEDLVIVGGGGLATAALEYLTENGTDFLAGWQDALAAFDGDGYVSDQIISEVADVVFSEVVIGRDVQVSGESSDDLIYFGGVDVGRDATINTHIGEDEIYFGVGADIQVFVPYDDGPAAGGGELFDNYLYLNAEVNVGRRATINAGDGDDLTRIGGSIGYFFEISDNPQPQDNGGDFGEYYNYQMYGGVHVGQDFNVSAGAHDDATYIAVRPLTFADIPSAPQADFSGDGDLNGDDGAFDVQVTRNMRVDMGADDDFLQVGGSTDSDLVLDYYYYGRGVGQSLGVDGNLTITTGPGTDEVLMGQQEPIISYYYGGDRLVGGEIAYYQIEVGKNFVLDTGWHDDVVSIAGHAYLYEYDGGGFGSAGNSLGTLSVGKDMKVDTNGGNDSFHMGHTSQHVDDNFGVINNSPAIAIGDDLQVLTGDQDDLLVLDVLFVGDDTKLDTYWGRDTITIGSQSSSVEFGDSSLLVLTSLERDTVELTETYVGGNLKMFTGLRDDLIVMTYVEVGKNLMLFTERGNDEVLMDSVAISGNSKIVTAGEDDTVEISNSSGGKLTVLMGDADDHLCIIDSSFSSAVLDGGSGEADELAHNLPVPPTEKNFELLADCLDIIDV